MRKTGLLLGLAGALALSTGCAQLPTSQQDMGSNGANYQISQRGGMLEEGREDGLRERREGLEGREGRIGERREGLEGREGRIGEIREGLEGREGRIEERREGLERREGRIGERREDRDRSRIRIRRPSWWGRREWFGRNIRPIWWGRRNYVVNRFIILGGYYYPYFIDDGYYYPDFTSPYIYVNGVYRPHYVSRPYVSTNVIPVGSAQIVTYGPRQLEVDED